MKISISGWAGAGSSTLAVILANSLNLKLLRGGEVFRYLYKNLNFKNTGEERIQAHNFVEPYFGPIFDRFVDETIKNEMYDNIIIESDITAFRVGKLESLFSIFLMPSEESRAKRMVTDNRGDDGEVLKELDLELRNRYKDLHGVDFLDRDQIFENHKLPLDTSDMSIKDELIEVYKKLTQDGFLNKQDALVHINNAEAEEKNYWEKGKDWYLEELRKKDQLYTSEEILKLIRENYGEEVKKLPKELRRLI